MEWRINGIDKARFVAPSMAWEAAGDLNSVIAEGLRNNLTGQVFHSFFQCPRESLPIEGGYQYWDALATHARHVGQLPTLVTAYDPFAASLLDWIHGPADRRPAERHIERVQGRASGAGTNYIGSIDGMEVFAAEVEERHSYLFSAQMLESVFHRQVTDAAFVSAHFEEGDNPWSGTIVVRFAQSASWRNTPILEFVTEDAPEEQEAPSAA